MLVGSEKRRLERAQMRNTGGISVVEWVCVVFRAVYMQYVMVGMNMYCSCSSVRQICQ